MKNLIAAAICATWCDIVQNFFDGKLRWKRPDNNTIFTVEGAYIKANNGKYLKRLSTNIVSAQDLVSTDNNFKWFLY